MHWGGLGGRLGGAFVEALEGALMGALVGALVGAPLGGGLGGGGLGGRLGRRAGWGNHRRRQHNGGRLDAWWDLREKRERKGKRGRCVSSRRVRLSQQ